MNPQILLADDDDDLRALLTRALQSQGYRVETARDGEEALDKITRGAPAVLLLDLVMPRLDGFGVLRRLAEAPQADMPQVIVLTGQSDQELPRALAAGAHDYVRKPVDLVELAARVETQVRLWRSRLELRERTAAVSRLADELAQTRDFLTSLIDTAVDAVVATDLRGRIRVFNKAAEQLFDRTAEAVIGQLHVTDLYPPGVAEQVMADIRARAHGGPGRIFPPIDREVIQPDGTRVPVLQAASVVHVKGEAVATVGILQDQRALIRMKVRLDRAEQLLQRHEKLAVLAELAGTTAHELNQPLTGVLGYSELILRRIPADDPRHRAAAAIREQALRMAEIVKRIGTITRYETKTYVGTTRIIDLEAATPTPPPDPEPEPT